MVNKERLIKSFIKMAETPSISGKENRMRELLQNEFHKRGLKLIEDDAAKVLGTNTGNLLVRIPGHVDYAPLLFSAHIDTVVPGCHVKVVRESDILRSDGTTILGSDDKAGVAAILEVVDVIMENDLPHPPLELLFTVGEESGLLGAKNFDYKLLQAAIGYVLDHGGSPGSIVINSPCQYELEFTVHGKAAHAGISPEDGLNAIHIMSKALAKMPCGRIDAETTCNFGIISGGLARNIVTEECRMLGEARSLKREKLENLVNEMVATFKQAVESNQATADVRKTFLYSEVSINPQEKVIQMALKAGEKLGLPVKLESTGGGSDASIINEHGITCANLGIGMSNVHTCNEYIKIEDLYNVASWVLEIIKTSILSDAQNQ